MNQEYRGAESSVTTLSLRVGGRSSCSCASQDRSKDHATSRLVRDSPDKDRYHSWTVEVASRVDRALLTCEAVLAETAFHLAKRVTRTASRISLISA